MIDRHVPAAAPNPVPGTRYPVLGTPVSVLAAGAALAGTGALASEYWVSVLVVAGIWSICAVGLSLVAGYAGQISLGHAAFYGIGAYTCGILTVTGGWSPWLGLAAGAVVTWLVAYPIGAVLLRLRGHYLALGTLGFGIIVNIMLLEWVPVTGGPSGFSGVPRPALPGFEPTGDRAFYYLVLVALLLVLWASLNLVNSSIGRALRALHSSEVAAETVGLDTATLKLHVFALSALFAGLAGGLFAQYVTFVGPRPFGFLFSVELIVMVALGGMASIWGALVGAASVLLLTQIIRNELPKYVPGAGGELELVAFGVLLVLIMLVLPRGVVPELARLVRRVAERPPAGRPAAGK